MLYDPIKKSLGTVFNKHTFLRKLFYKLLDLLLLRAWHIHKEINKWSSKNNTTAQIFDAGMGFGQYSFYLSSISNKYSIYGVDVKEEQVEDCNSFFKKIGRNNVSFEVADLTKIDIKDRFDLALSVDVMEHILEDVLVFENICKSLKKGGMLLISTPSDQGGSDVSHEGEGSFIEEHVRDGYNIDEIKQKLSKAGFSNSEVNYSYGKYGSIAWRLSMKYPIQMLGFTKLFFVILPFYYIFFYPICFVLNYIDTHSTNKTGTGLIVKAWK
jgi:SAM-dependent methyltransferase